MNDFLKAVCSFIKGVMWGAAFLVAAWIVFAVGHHQFIGKPQEEKRHTENQKMLTAFKEKQLLSVGINTRNCFKDMPLQVALVNEAEHAPKDLIVWVEVFKRGYGTPIAKIRENINNNSVVCFGAPQGWKGGYEVQWSYQVMGFPDHRVTMPRQVLLGN